MAERERDPRVEQLLDKQEIREVVYRYCRGVDRLDRDLVRSCYHDDATDLHGSFEGGVEAYLDWSWRILTRYEVTQHYIANVLVELHGDRARAESYGVAMHRGDPEIPERNLITGFRFVDRFGRRDPGGWRIARRVATTEWVILDAPEQRWPIGENLLRGRRDRSDPVYEPLD